MFDKRIKAMTMKVISFLRLRVVVGLILLALLTSGCDLPASILMGLERICNQPELVVNTTVDTNDVLCTLNKCSLRDAISTANACPGMQNIRIPAGNYVLTRTGAGENHNRTGDLDITSNVNITGEQGAKISGDQADRIFDVMPDVTADITGLELYDGQVVGNTSQGGAIRNQGTLQINNSNIHDNGASMGGAIANSGQLTLNKVVIQGNAADAGGGISTHGETDITQSAIVDNNGISVAVAPLPTWAAEVGGSALFAGSGADVNIRNTTISGNEDDSLIGAIDANSSHITMEFVTVADNLDDLFFASDVTGSIESSIIAGNACEVPGCAPNCRIFGLHLSHGFNIDSGSTCGFDQANDLNNTDPLLNPLSASGDTFVETFDTAAPSPALDSIDPSSCMIIDGYTADQVGTARPQGTGCDRGAWEAPTASATAPLVIAPTPTASTSMPLIIVPSIPTVAPTMIVPLATFVENAFCRRGPGTVYPEIGSFEKGQQAQIDGQNNFSPRWYWVQIPNSNEHCWVSEVTVQTSGPVDAVPEQAAPPTPAPTKRSAQGPACSLISSDKQCNNTSGCVFDYKTKKCVKK